MVSMGMRVLNCDEDFGINEAMPVGKQHDALAGIRLVLDRVKGGLQGQADGSAAMRRFDFTDGVIPGGRLPGR